ncbi:glutamate receptor 2.8-like [Hordeum vulgare subsp. vulgare]|uniref:Ionotropic glutamate receptor C-terminal domain-containing protein n=1 Tax=Hordeum vulgare subsp. vulgare TaxID=112509 RepID=A0A8I6YA03_HORVV|nr:glutamate receptor 2.8-like [Hordeum vulgare subsp. vulgare]
MEFALAVSLLVILALRTVPAAATAAVPVRAGVQDPADGSISVAPVAYHLDRLPGGSPEDATPADIERRNTTILWRREAGGSTKGYLKKLKIAVPYNPGFNVFVNATSEKVTGYCIDVFEAATKDLPHVLDYGFVVVDGLYDQLVRDVSSGIFDAAVGDITITAERAAHVDFTMPYIESGVSLLVLNENDSKPTIEWVFLKPLTTELWLAIVGGFLFTGIVVWMIERPKNLEYQGSSSRQFSTALYFSFSTLTFSHGQVIRSPLSKIVVVIWCFVVLVIVQSYTASLSSILTAKRLRPSVTNLGQLLSNGDYIGYASGSFVHSVLRKQGFAENRLKAYGMEEEYANALRKGSKNGGVAAIVDEIPYLTSFLSDPRYHNEFQMINGLYKTPGFGFVFPRDSPLVHNLSVAILGLIGGDEGSRIEAKWLGTTTPLPSYGIPNTDAAPLTLRSFSGLFIITVCITALMLLVRIAKLVHAKYTKVRDSDMQRNGDGGSEGLGGSGPLQNTTGNGSMADQPHLEARNEDPQGVNGSGESPGDVEPNESVPEHAILIEMNTR